MLPEIDDFSFFREELTPLGYSGHFVAKARSPCLKFEGNIGPDGNAVFVKTGRFSIAKTGSVVLEREDGGGPTNSTAAWLSLKDGEDSSLCFVTTHFKAGEDPEFAETRRQQAIDLAKVRKL